MRLGTGGYRLLTCNINVGGHDNIARSTCTQAHTV